MSEPTIPPWSEAERKRMEELADWCEVQAEFERRLTALRLEAVYNHARENAHWGLHALALRACLARAEQADKLEHKLNADSQNFEIECLRAQVDLLRQRAEQAEQALADAAHENCAGPVAHRIRVLKAELAAQIIPVADRERALEIAKRIGLDSGPDSWPSPEDIAECRRLLKLEDA